MAKEARLAVVRNPRVHTSHPSGKDPGVGFTPGRPVEPDWMERFPAARANAAETKENAIARDKAKEAWVRWCDELEKLGLLSPAYGDVLLEAATCVGRIWQCERDVSKRGVNVPSSYGKKTMAMNRSVTAAVQYRNALQRFVSQLGLAPNARLSPRDDSPDADSVWDD